MWLLILAGFLAVSAGEETVASVAEKAQSATADDIVLLEIDVKDPVKRSPVSASGVYGGPPSQYVIRPGDDGQQLSPEYLAILQQFSGTEPPAYANANNVPQRRPVPVYAKQQQALQQAYYNYRKPAVVPARPRPQLHPQAYAQAEVAAPAQPQAHGLSGASTYQLEAYSQPKLGSFEQELLQLVSANQAQEFNLIPTQAKEDYSQPQYVKPTAAPAPVPHLAEQYHIETSPPPRYQPQHRPAVAAAYQSIEQPVQYQQQLQYHQAVQTYSPKSNPSVRPFRPSPQYDYASDEGQLKAEAEANARAQADAEARAIAFQKIVQDSYQKHREAAIEQIRIDQERHRQNTALEQIRVEQEKHRQQTALEQIQQGTQVSDAGRAHNEGELQPKDPEAAYRAKLKAQAAAEAAEARRVQTEAEYKAHQDAIRHVEAQQHAHVRAQEKAHQDALNFERNQLRAQAQAQALAEAQAVALYKAYQQSRAKANSEVLQAARAQQEAKKADPNGTPVLQFLLPNAQKLPEPNSYFTNDNNKYQSSGSTYVSRSVAKPESGESVSQDQVDVQSSVAINQPRQLHKLKVPPTQSSPVYISQSGLLKKSPVKSVTIEEIIDHDNGAHIVRIPSPKDQQPLTQEELSVLINAGYSVTPIPQTVKPTPQSYVPDSTSATYYLKKQRPVARPEYVAYEEVVQRPRRPARKNTSILKQDEGASEKVTYLVPLEPSFGTRQSPLRQDE
jgi:hypothetical protein